MNRTFGNWQSTSPFVYKMYIATHLEFSIVEHYTCRHNVIDLNYCIIGHQTTMTLLFLMQNSIHPNKVAYNFNFHVWHMYTMMLFKFYIYSDSPGNPNPILTAEKQTKNYSVYDIFFVSHVHFTESLPSMQ